MRLSTGAGVGAALLPEPLEPELAPEDELAVVVPELLEFPVVPDEAVADGALLPEFVPLGGDPVLAADALDLPVLDPFVLAGGSDEVAAGCVLALEVDALDPLVLAGGSDKVAAGCVLALADELEVDELGAGWLEAVGWLLLAGAGALLDAALARGGGLLAAGGGA